MTQKPSRTAGRGDVIRAGFMPLLDAAPLIVASRLGFARAEGIALELIRETSWATLRDRLAVRQLDVAHMLAPMAVNDSLGLTPLPVGLIVPMTLGTGGNTVTVSQSLYDATAAAMSGPPMDPSATARAFAVAVAARKGGGAEPPVIAIVHAHSAHHYQLAHWLAHAGLRLGVDVSLVVVPPPLMPEALSGAQIDGFCAGEPWGSAAVAQGSGHILTTSSRIWPGGPEKVLGVRARFADEDAGRLRRLLRAVMRAARWCDDPANRPELAHLLAGPEMMGVTSDVIAAGLALPYTTAGATLGSGFLQFASDSVLRPLPEQAALIYAQMVRWGQADHAPASALRAVATYRPDLYDDAAATMARDTSNDAAAAGATGVLFDDATFDPSRIEDYLLAVGHKSGAH